MKKEQIYQLFEQMTLKEKLGQLSQSTGEHFIGKVDGEMVETGPDFSDLNIDDEQLYTMGSVLGVSSAKITNAIQKSYLEKSRLKIPMMFMHDAIHGYKTIFPIPLALSCSFDKEILKKTAAFTAQELRAAGIHADFSPMTDLVRDARWGRVMESFGEDHILSGDLGKAMIEGYQKEENGKIGKTGVAACLKHFAGYGAAAAGVDYAAVDMSMKEFFGYYGKPYEIALRAKPRMVMSSFNSFNGEPVTASKNLLDHILRDIYGFEKLIISDWGAVPELKNHGVAKDDKEAALKSLNAGVDIEMVSSTYMQFGEEIIKDRPEMMEKIDQAVLKLLELKNDLGLFENPYVDEAEESKNIHTEEALEAAKEAAKASCVLLKNEGLLPLSDKLKRILVLGKFSDTKELLGNWACKGSFADVISVSEGIKKVMPDIEVFAYQSLEECPEEILENIEHIIVTIGEAWDLSGEGHSSADIELDETQIRLIHKLRRLHTPFTGVGFAGRPIALQRVIDEMDALLWCWYPGTMGGAAIAELIFGKSSPCGKLTMSFPRVGGQVPIRYNEYRSGRPANESTYSSRYQDCKIGPLFPFGHGLSYADLEYRNFQVSSEEISKASELTITFEIQNKSQMDCSETAILFIQDLISKEVRPVREMVKYEKVHLKKGEHKKVCIHLTVDDLCYIDHQLKPAIEPGEFELYLNDLNTPVSKIRYVNV